MSFGFAFLSYTNSVLESGINIVIDETKLETYIADADIVITGEGRLDGQTVMGKAPIGVAGIAKNIKNQLSHICQKPPYRRLSVPFHSLPA